MPGILAALWLIGLYAAAPLLRARRDEHNVADRLRDALILGAAIPFALGLVHLLDRPACFAALALCVAAAARRHGWRALAGPVPSRTPAYLTLATLLAVIWPQLVRPLLDGDSLSYHLPNAAAWVQAHSLWTTATRYWWYPPGSELFTAGLYASRGVFALPWCGAAALALLASRVLAWGRDAVGLRPLAADALAAATISAAPLALQGGTLQNDVWLAAFFLESLWLLGIRAPAGAPAVAITALIKPQGWLFAAIALCVTRAPRTAWLAAAAAVAAWLLHDALLLHGALLSPAATSAFAHPERSTILAHGLGALGLLLRVAATSSPFFLLALALAFGAPLLRGREPALRWGAFAAAVLFLLLPFGYTTNVAQLATGASLRFAAPAIAAGALLLGGSLRRLQAIATAAFAASAIFGVWTVAAIFWNDGTTHAALALSALGVGVAALAARRRAAWPALIAAAGAVVLASHLAARHPVDYYDDALRVDGIPPGIYRWIAAARPAAIGGVGLRLGVVNVLSPSTRTSDLLDAGACGAARRGGLVLVAVAQSDLPAEVDARRLAGARACGRTLYADPIGVAALPTPSPAAR